MSAPRKLTNAGTAMTRCKELPLADREIIWGWCQSSDKTLTGIRAEIKAAYGISFSSDSQLSRWKDWQFQQQRTERLNAWTEELEESLKQFNPNASMDAVRSFTLSTLLKEAMASGNGEFALEVLDRDLKERGLAATVAARGKDLEIKERRLKLIEAQAAQAQATEKVLDSKLTDAQRAQRIKEIYGRA